MSDAQLYQTLREEWLACHAAMEAERDGRVLEASALHLRAARLHDENERALEAEGAIRRRDDASG